MGKKILLVLKPKRVFMTLGDIIKKKLNLFKKQF